MLSYLAKPDKDDQYLRGPLLGMRQFRKGQLKKHQRKPKNCRSQKIIDIHHLHETKVMDMFNGQGRGAELSSAKDTAYGLLCSITEFADHERRAMSIDHRLDSAWFGAGAALKQRGLEQALRLAV